MESRMVEDELYAHDDPIGPENDEYLEEVCSEADLVVAAWGTDGDLLNRGREVEEMLAVDLHALDTTADGHPNHPLYQRKELEPEPWSVDDLDG